MNNTREVQYAFYCKRCTHYETEGFNDPCDECLRNFVNIDSRKPVKFNEETDKKKLKSRGVT